MNNIREMRTKTGMTQQELAQKIETDRSTIAKWETGKSNPRSDKLVDISVALGCTLDDLMKKKAG